MLKILGIIVIAFLIGGLLSLKKPKPEPPS